MPLRGLLYFADLYRQLFGSRHLYSTKLLHLPTPVYIVFYNGKQEIGEEKILKLSDSFSNSNGHPKLELETRILNINHGHNQKLLEHCRTLREYSIFVDKIKSYNKTLELSEAIQKPMDECIAEDVLQNFLIKRRSEVMNSLLTEYDEERVLADLNREFYEDGEAAGIQKGIQQGIQQGKDTHLLELIQKKLQKGKTPEQIAEDLEDTPERIRALISKIEKP